MSEKKKKNKVTIGLLAVSAFWPLLLSHHPECYKFDNHTINIGKIRFCIGCFIGYPTAFIGIILINLLNISNIIPTDYFLAISIILISTFFMSPLHLTRVKLVKIIQKFLIGLGSSFLFWAIWSLPNPILTNYFIFIYTFSILLGVLNFYHIFGFLSKCYRCDTPFSWGKCDGFDTIRSNLTKFKMGDFMLSFNDFSKQIEERKKRKNQNKTD
ncbi:MAG: hypothetical protein ACTSV5_15045 [Promethearchaeota archaeon]